MLLLMETVQYIKTNADYIFLMMIKEELRQLVQPESQFRHQNPKSAVIPGAEDLPEHN